VPLNKLKAEARAARLAGLEIMKGKKIKASNPLDRARGSRDSKCSETPPPK
jgi:hypothetical protein